MSQFVTITFKFCHFSFTCLLATNGDVNYNTAQQ